MRSVRRLIDDGLARQGAPGQEGKPHSGGASPCANSVQARSDELTSGLEIDAPGFASSIRAWSVHPQPLEPQRETVSWMQL